MVDVDKVATTTNVRPMALRVDPTYLVQFLTILITHNYSIHINQLS